MDKNNDIQVNKVDKWDKGIADKSLWQAKWSVDIFLYRYSSMLSMEALDAVRTIYVYLDEALDRFNELEARHQKDTGLISEYEEDNKKLQQSNELCMKAHLKLIDESTKLATENAELRSKCESNEEELRIREKEKDILLEQKNRVVGDNDNLRRERDRHIDLLDKLRWALEDKGICCEWSEAALKWRLYGKNKLFDELREHYEEELRIREKEKDEKDKLIDELNLKIEELKLNTKMMHGLDRKIQRLEKENEELETKNRSLQLRTNMMYACRRSTDNANQKMAKTVADFENKNEELNRKIEELTYENRVLKLKNYSNGTYGLTGKIEALEKENKELKDTLAKDRELGKYVGKCVADSIQEGWKNGAYELHPYTRFDIHVAETKNTSTSFDHYSIPYIAVMFNNTQTEMERDTAQHECEELDKKVDRLWSVNEELNRKIKELKKENKELKATLAVCAVDANTAKNLCNGIVSKAKHAKNNKEEK